MFVMTLRMAAQGLSSVRVARVEGKADQAHRKVSPSKTTANIAVPAERVKPLSLLRFLPSQVNGNLTGRRRQFACRC
jgi:hypothetical protein